MSTQRELQRFSAVQLRIINRVRVEVPEGTSDLLIKMSCLAHLLIIALRLDSQFERADVGVSLIAQMLEAVGRHAGHMPQRCTDTFRVAQDAILEELDACKRMSHPG